ncbi:MAG: 16S rRNA (guanine(966)-N(2))-methyltransferase RsmD [Gammaproteobacteria bacterium]|nr:16S rRNA (guanine(966)-N(2))-methyltransferase RsmD [Gammaproteobacteria bacterium]
MPHLPNAKRNTLRIIGGRWRGRKLSFANAPDLRPTPERVRETLFNWLQKNIIGARCLDLFSGSGALGLEALSRGAEFCLFLDAYNEATTHIKTNLALLQANHETESPDKQNNLNYAVQQTDTLRYLARHRFVKQYDLVFIDPPFQLDCITTCCQLLEIHHWLTNNAVIYIESSNTIKNHHLPVNWQLYRHKQAGNVHYHLVIRTDS